MATLAKDKPRVFENHGDYPVYNEIPVKASDIVYAGAAVTYDGSGNAEPLSTSNEFAGFAVEQCDNSTGSAGDKRVKVLQKGYAKLTVTGATALTHVNDAVYATDDDTFTLTASGALQIGKVFRAPGTGSDLASGEAIVYFEALGSRSI